MAAVAGSSSSSSSTGAGSTAAPFALDVTPTPEQVLKLLDAAPDGTIADSRTLVASSLPASASTSASTAAASTGTHAFKQQAAWQLGLQGVLNSLASREMVAYANHDELSYALTPEGTQIVADGSHEARLWHALPADAAQGLSIDALREKLGAASLKVGQGNAMKKKWIVKLPDGTFARNPAVSEIADETRAELESIARTGQLPGGAADAKKVAELKKRTLISQQKLVYFSIKKGPAFALTVEKLETDLTAEMIASGAWKKAPFKKYNFDAEGAVPAHGALHPLLKVREEFRNIFFEMGFSEMPTNRFVESSFWCFDSLFVPQQHAARDMQDTFFIRDPPAAKHIPEDYLERVSTVHSTGSHGSTGYKYPFSREVTEKLVLRTHTTAVSAAMLYKLANQPGGFQPAKLFSIDRVFRNEAVDATHLAEFHQVEGVVADYNITLGDLIGFMQIFFSKMGVTDLRFKPAYNPYTEPSLEIFSYHKGLKKWVEIGNSGMFRPEMLRPMGLPEGVNVLGWGLSLERPTMIRYGINNIRELVGHKVPIESVVQASAVRFS
ncbi:Phenylalanyl-tRNA synthetase, beta subunit, cytoplasmic [Tilletia horrida]|uniref:phenylalanine--tRNA ligase n=1 Tax=Tilletia horrida TaxID=155126 RepID=A0AAN6GH89_9BASI|nr:Phenylalanyl-tRNA synthetase, beta subunit, cytoplasmic [Tilletia horrida]KAK0537478.1 Phenylalanyl-tRNA synthetase, beta subunit, cytoplasmic [Tilletia horrida]